VKAYALNAQGLKASIPGMLVDSSHRDSFWGNKVERRFNTITVYIPYFSRSRAIKVQLQIYNCMLPLILECLTGYFRGMEFHGLQGGAAQRCAYPSRRTTSSEGAAAKETTKRSKGEGHYGVHCAITNQILLNSSGKGHFPLRVNPSLRILEQGET
jgi:hypothetical protein